jgi:hypothetical protein
MYIVCSKVKFNTQISLMLPEFTHFIFITIDTFITTDTTFTTKHIYFIKINTNPVAGPKCNPHVGGIDIV